MKAGSMVGGGTDKLGRHVGGMKDWVVLMVVGGCQFPSCIAIFVDKGERDLLCDRDRECMCESCV